MLRDGYNAHICNGEGDRQQNDQRNPNDCQQDGSQYPQHDDEIAIYTVYCIYMYINILSKTY